MSRSASVRLWLTWALATLGSYVAAQLALLMIGQLVGGDRVWVTRGTGLVFPIWGALGSRVLVAAIIEMGCAYALIGAIQWVVLRRVLPGAGWWIVATALGGAIGELGMTLSPLWSTAVLGIAQCLVLRRTLPRANWWPLATILGLSLVRAVELILDRSQGLSLGAIILRAVGTILLGGAELYSSGGIDFRFDLYLLAATLKGGLIGAVTGTALVSMLREREARNTPIGPLRIDARLGALIGVISGSAIAAHSVGRAVGARVPGSWSTEGVAGVITFIVAAIEGIIIGGLLGRWIGKQDDPTIVRIAICAGAVFGAEALSALAIQARLAVGLSVYIPIVVGSVGGALLGRLAGDRVLAIQRQP
jgi:hypothetical protein